MSKRFFWIFLLLCCSVAVTLVLVQSRVHLSPQRGEPSEISAENPTEVPQPGFPSTKSGAVVGPTGTSEPQSPAPVSVPTLEPPSEKPEPRQSTARLQLPELAKRQPEAVSSQQTERQAEVWSYPPLLQQNASNDFVRAMDNLSNAKTESDRYRALGNAAKSDFIYGKTEDARNYASELLSLDEQFKGEPWRDGSAVYDANLVLGRLAAQEGRIDDAKQYLLESGKSSGSPVLGSFGPNMSLARDLLQSGERDGVLEFFDLCRNFWVSGDEKLTLWSDDVRAGRVPDFGANLFY